MGSLKHTDALKQIEFTKKKIFKKTNGQKYDLILFYSTACRYCIPFCKTLKKYASDNGFNVQAFKLTNDFSPYFPKSVLVDQNLIDKYFGKGVQVAIPVLFILNPKNMYVYPVSRGNLSCVELSTRMNVLMKKIKQFEGGRS